MSQFGSLLSSGEVQPMAIFTTHSQKLESHEVSTPLSPRAGEVFDGQSHPSFEAVLSGNSQAPYSRVAFSDFLKKFHCSENLEFLISSDRLITTDPHDFKQKEQLWHFIFATFISTDSPKEVNIPHELKYHLSECFDRDEIPCDELVTRTMISIKDLLRDAYVQFTQGIKKQQQRDSFFADGINEHYCLLPTPTEENSTHPHRRFSETCSPLDPPSVGSSRCPSPLSATEYHQVSRDMSSTPIPRSLGAHDTREDATAVYSSDESTKKDSFSSQKSSKNPSFSEASGLKKFAGKFRWRRLSSNSSMSSN